MSESPPKRRRIASTDENPDSTVEPDPLARFRRHLALFLLTTPRGLRYSKTDHAQDRIDEFLSTHSDSDSLIETEIATTIEGNSHTNVFLRTVEDRLRKIRVGHIRSFYELYDSEERLSKEAMVVSLGQAFRTGTFPWSRRQEESRVLEEVDTVHVHVTMCGIEVPKDVLVGILSFHGYDASLFSSFAPTCWDAFVVVLSSWNPTSGLFITKSNLYTIPTLVLRQARSLRLACHKPFSLKELRYLWSTNESTRLETLELLGSKSWRHFPYSELHKIFRTMAEIETKFPKLQLFSFPPHFSGDVSTSFPGIEEFDLHFLAPSLTHIRYPVSWNWCRNLWNQLEEIEMGTNVNIEVFERCQNSLRRISLPFLGFFCEGAVEALGPIIGKNQLESVMCTFHLFSKLMDSVMVTQRQRQRLKSSGVEMMFSNLRSLELRCAMCSMSMSMRWTLSFPSLKNLKLDQVESIGDAVGFMSKLTSASFMNLRVVTVKTRSQPLRLETDKDYLQRLLSLMLESRVGTFHLQVWGFELLLRGRGRSLHITSNFRVFPPEQRRNPNAPPHPLALPENQTFADILHSVIEIPSLVPHLRTLYTEFFALAPPVFPEGFDRFGDREWERFEEGGCCRDVLRVADETIGFVLLRCRSGSHQGQYLLEFEPRPRE